MTKEEAVKAISKAVRGEDTQANKEAVANVHFESALSKLGRMHGVSFNTRSVTFSLVAGQSSYQVGVDILSAYSEVWEFMDLYRNDQVGFPVSLIGYDDFSSIARGSTQTGGPELATYHSIGAVFEIWPIPDTVYTITGKVRLPIASLNDIPSSYHSVVVDLGIRSVNASYDPNMAVLIANESIAEIQKDSRTSWSGGKIIVEQPFTVIDRKKRADSGNLRP